MAAAHISIAGTLWGGKLRAYRDALALVIDEGPDLLAKMSQMIDATPNPDDYTELESQFGLEVGDGQQCWGELAAVVVALQANPAESTSQAGDAALLATKLKQFVDVVG
jgi:hypothetical protein